MCVYVYVCVRVCSIGGIYVSVRVHGVTLCACIRVCVRMCGVFKRVRAGTCAETPGFHPQHQSVNRLDLKDRSSESYKHHLRGQRVTELS